MNLDIFQHAEPISKNAQTLNFENNKSYYFYPIL